LSNLSSSQSYNSQSKWINHAPSYFLNKHQRFPGSHSTKTFKYVRDILCLPKEWCSNSPIPGGEKKFLTENGLLGKIEFHSATTEQEIMTEMYKVFVRPMGLSSSNIENDKTFNFTFLKWAGAGSCTLCKSSVASSFQWNGKHVSTLAKAGGIANLHPNIG